MHIYFTMAKIGFTKMGIQAKSSHVTSCSYNVTSSLYSLIIGTPSEYPEIAPRWVQLKYKESDAG